MESYSNMTKYFLLAELRKSDMHGYDLISHLEKVTGKKPSPSQIYPVLKQMKSAGYVTAHAKTVGGKKVNTYRLTESGKQLFDIMNRRFESMIKSVLVGRVKTCAHCSCEILKGAVRKKIGSKTLYFCCVSCAASYHGH